MEKKTVEELKAICRSKSIPVYGTKAQLIERIQKAKYSRKRSRRPSKSKSRSKSPRKRSRRPSKSRSRSRRPSRRSKTPPKSKKPRRRTPSRRSPSRPNRKPSTSPRKSVRKNNRSSSKKQAKPKNKKSYDQIVDEFINIMSNNNEIAVNYTYLVESTFYFDQDWKYSLNSLIQQKFGSNAEITDDHIEYLRSLSPFDVYTSRYPMYDNIYVNTDPYVYISHMILQKAEGGISILADDDLHIKFVKDTLFNTADFKNGIDNIIRQFEYSYMGGFELYNQEPKYPYVLIKSLFILKFNIGEIITIPDLYQRYQSELRSNKDSQMADDIEFAKNIIENAINQGNL